MHLCISYCLQDFDSQSLAKLAYGLAAVGYDDPDLYSAITTAAAADLDSLTPADVSMILWACGEQGNLCDKFMSGKHIHQLCSRGGVCATVYWHCTTRATMQAWVLESVLLFLF